MKTLKQYKNYQDQIEDITMQKKELAKLKNFEAIAALRDKEIILTNEKDIFEKENKLRLSKSKYVKGCNCTKALWLYVYKPEEGENDDEAISIMQMGTNVGDLARKCFPNGILAVKEGEYPSSKTADYTQELISKGATTIYEATFIYDNIVVAVDVLTMVDNKWVVYEVKSSTKLKDYHITDASIQYYVLHKNLNKIKDINIMCLNNQYVRNGSLDFNKLFISTSVLENILPLQAEIENNVNNLRYILLSDEPKIEMGDQCLKPFECEFINYCNQGCETETEEIIVGKEVFNKEEITSFINDIQYPIAFLDFETIMPSVPEYNESRPYQKLVFQYSCHTQQKMNASINHTECLAKNIGDPRLEIIPNLIASCKNAKTIFVYNIGFEKTCIKEMKRDFPEFEKELQTIIEKLVDLMPIFRKHYRTSAMGKRYSIKVVLPAIVPHLSYNNLEIADGGNASASYYALYNETDKQKIKDVRNNLIEYCKMDTLAMVELWKVLESI